MGSFAAAKRFRQSLTFAAVLKTPYMWTENTVLRSRSAANTDAALSRIVNAQSWPRLGASTISV